MAAPQEEAGLETEEQARAFWYAVLSRLFYAPPDRALLDGLAGGAQTAPETEPNPFVESWSRLQSACRAADPDALREEFESLFVGVGKAPVTPYTSAYSASHAPDRNLLALRNTLNQWGLTRRDRVFELEDHVSALFDGMRWLIEQHRPLEDQRTFFDNFIAASVPLFCDAIAASAAADFYRHAAQFARTFIALEKDAFDMHTTA